MYVHCTMPAYYIPLVNNKLQRTKQLLSSHNCSKPSSKAFSFDFVIYLRTLLVVQLIELARQAHDR